MAKFIFPMEKILDLKRKIEKQEEINLGERMKELNTTVQQMEVLKMKLADTLFDLQGELSSGHIIATNIKLHNDAIKFYQIKIEEQEEVIQQANQKVEEQKERLKKALQERKAYELLREKAYEIYMEEEKVTENKIVDEIVSFKYKNASEED